MMMMEKPKVPYFLYFNKIKGGVESVEQKWSIYSISRAQDSGL